MSAESVQPDAPLSERRPPTHTMHVAIPLYIGEGQTLYVDPVQDALRKVMAISRIATLGLLCGEPVLSVEEAS